MSRVRFLRLASGGALLIRTVDPGNRLRLPQETSNHAPWLREPSQKLYMIPGAHGGVLVLRESVASTRDELQVISALQNCPLKAEETNTDLMRLMRYQLTRCEVEFSKDRFGIGLPREFRDMGLLPNQGESAAVFIFCDIIEIWRADKWVEHIRAVRDGLSIVIERALNELEEREL